MKRAIALTLGLGLLLALPAISQDEGKDELKQEIDALRKQVAKQDQQIKALQSYVDVMKSESATLAKKLRFAGKKGFIYPTPHTDARKALLYGLTRFADAGATGVAPKVAPKVADEDDADAAIDEDEDRDK